MNDSRLRNTVIGFALAAALFVAVDGYLITESVAGTLAAALFGGLVGGGLVLLAWRRRAFDATSASAEPAHRTNYMAVWVALFYLVSNEILGSVVAPKIRGATMQLHPVLLIFFTLAFALAFGLLGAIVATPAAAFFSAFYSEFYMKRPLARADH